MQIISIKWKIIVLLLMTNINLQAQLKSYKCNQHLVYRIGQGTELQSLVFSDKIDSPIFRLQYDEKLNFSDCDNLDFYYQFEGKTYDLQGKKINKKYVLANAISLNNIQCETLLSVDGIFSTGKFNCKKYQSEVREGEKVVVLFTTNLNNDIDYNKPMKELAKFLSVEIPFLAKGEIIFQIGAEFKGKMEFIFFEFVRNEDGSEELVLSQKNLTDIYKSLILNERSYEDENVLLSPSYCSILDLNENVDQDVREKIEEFLGNMCIYFDHFGNINNKDFCNYYNIEIEREATFLNEYKILDSLKIEQLKKVLERYKDSNLKENFK